MMNLLKIFFVFLACFFIINPAVFATNVYSERETAELCSRETDVFVDRAINDEDAVRNYEVSLSGSAAQWGVVSPANFILAPGEDKVIYTYITAPREANARNYNLHINVDSGASRRTINHVVRIKDCHGFSLTANQNFAEACPMDSSRFRAVVTNTGEFTQNFNLNLGGNLASSAVLSENAFVLQPGESKQAVININSPSDDGNYNLDLNVNGERNSRSINFNLKVNKCYQYELSVRSETNKISMCERTITSIPFNIKNYGTTQNEFVINIEEGPVWARLNMDKISLNVNESRTFLVALAPDHDKTGNYSLSVVVSPERGDIVARGNAEIEVRDCHSVNLDVTPLEDTICKGLTGAYTINIENDGESRKNYNISVEGPSWVGLAGDSLITLNPGKGTNIALFARPGEDALEGEYQVIVAVNAMDISRTSAEETINIDVAGSDECFAADIILNYENVVVHYDSGLLVPVTFKNSGSKIADYSVVLDGSASDFSNLAEGELSIEPGSEKTVNFYIAPKIDTIVGEYTLDLSLNVGNAAIGSRTINVEVTDDPSRITVINGDETVDEFGKNFFKDNKFFVFLFLALILIVILAVLFGRKTIDFFEDVDEEEGKKKKKQEEN